MQPTRFRAYAVETAQSRRTVDGEKQNIDHEVENPAFEGKVTDGAVTFDSGKTVITKVVVYGGEGDDETVLASVGFNRPGKFDLSFLEATDTSDARIVEA